jgi:hypothetical protein
MQMHDVFRSLRVGEPVASNGLQVFPLFLPADEDASCVLLDELLESGLAEITEVSAGGSVPDLAVENRSEHDALILDGLELHGAKQNRMVNLTLIIQAKSRTVIPVSCVERGRWSYRGRTFSSSGRTVSSRLRTRKYEAVQASLKTSGKGYADQMDVWDCVDQYLGSSGARSGTHALSDAYASQSKALQELTGGLRDLDAHGAVVVLQGRIEGMDLLSRRDHFRKLWPALLDGYALEALLSRDTGRAPASAAMVSGWLDHAVTTASLTPHEVPGVGEYLECRSDVANGGVVAHRGRLVHVMLFPPLPKVEDLLSDAG